jgi:peptidoglycan hydrolase-like protein with peptidoglycan-binding domain
MLKEGYMERRLWLLGLVTVFVIALSGCSTGRNKDLEIQGLRNQVTALEAQKPAKIEETDSSEQVLSKSSEETVVEDSAKLPDNKQIQTALENAGYYKGDIDGKIGRRSRQAIRDFQKANDLMVDGKVGKKTWAALKEYLNKKVK